MSSFEYYKTKNYSQRSPVTRIISNASTAANIVIWTPTTSLRLAVTEVNVSSNPGGTIQFYFGGNNNAQKLAEFTVGASSTIYPAIQSWESTAIDAPLYVNVSTGTTNGWSLTVQGFELD